MICRIQFLFLLLFSFSAIAQNTTDLKLTWDDTLRVSALVDGSTIDYLYFDGADYDQRNPQIPVHGLYFDVPTYGKYEVEIYQRIYEPIDPEQSNLIDFTEISSTITHNVLKQRQQYKLYIQYCPIRKNTSTGNYEKLVSAKISYRLTQAIPYGSSTKRNSYTTTSVLNDGNIYKIRLNQTGLYKMDYALLLSLGVDVDNIDPRNIQLFGNGGTMLTERMDQPYIDDLQECAIEVIGESDGSFDNGDYILFYAVGTKNWDYNVASDQFYHTQNVYTDNSHYFIKIGTNNGKRISLATNDPSATNVVNSYDELVHHEVDEINLMEQEFALPPSGLEWYGESFRTTRNRSFFFDFTNRIESEPVNVYTDLAVRAFSQGLASYTLNGVSQASVTTPSTTVYIYSDYAKRLTFPNNQQTISGQDINLDISFIHASSSANMWLNYVSLHARSELRFNSGQLLFRDRNSLGSSLVKYQIVNSGSMQVYDVTDPSNLIKMTLDGSSVKEFTSDASMLRTFIAYDGNTLFTPEGVGAIPNQNLHGITSQPEALIVCHSSLRSEAERLAEHRSSHDGMSVIVVDVEDIYNEFSSGNEDITAIRDFERMLYARQDASNPFTHILLFGIGTFDYKSIGKDRDQTNNPNLIPVYQTRESLNPIVTYTSDDYFGLMDSSELMNQANLLDVAVGRLPAANIDEARIYVDKIIGYETDRECLKDWKNRICFVADDEDNNLHFLDAEKAAFTASGQDSTYNVEKIYLDAYNQVSTSGGSRYPDAKNAFLDVIFKGSFIVNYLGHGGDDGWTQERIFTSNDIINLTNDTKLPLFITATCSFGPHDDPLLVSAGELLLLNPNGGAISLFTTVRVVIASHNETLVRNTFNVVFDKKPTGEYLTTGEVMLQAKNNASNASIIVNSRKYALLGDPTMKLSYPEYSVYTTELNGQPLNNLDTLKALEQVTISGVVKDQNGNIATNYNGVLFPTVFDKEDRLFTLANDAGSNIDDFMVRKKNIFKGQASIVNGTFSFSFVVPKDINYQVGNGKISYYSNSNFSLEEGAGYSTDLLVGGSASNVDQDNQGPDVEVYMNNDKFARGGMTDKNPQLFVKLFDENGINTVGNSIGHDLEATLTLPDGSQSTYILNDFYESTIDDYTRGTITYPLKDLAYGNYSVTVRAWDTYNNPGEGDTEFVVAPTEDLAIRNVLNYPNPFTTLTSFQFEHNYPYQALDVQVQVYTVSGRLVKTIDRSISAEENTGYRIDDITWDGLDEFGDALAKGVYIYKVFIRLDDSDDPSRKASEFQKLVILK